MAVNPFLSDPCGKVLGMTSMVATESNALGRYLIELGNADDVDGFVVSYDPNVVPAFLPGSVASGHAENPQSVRAARPLPARRIVALGRGRAGTRAGAQWRVDERRTRSAARAAFGECLRHGLDVPARHRAGRVLR